MKQTKKITVSAMAVALGVVFMTLGFFVEALDLTVAALCSIIMLFVFIEVGKPYTFLVWLCTSLLGALFFTGSLVWVTYFLVFGIYPIVKAYIERAKRIFWLPLKLVFFNISALILISVSEFILGIPFFGEINIPLFEGKEWIFKALVYVLLNLAFVVYDIFLTLMVKAYFLRVRPRISKIIK